MANVENIINKLNNHAVRVITNVIVLPILLLRRIIIFGIVLPPTIWTTPRSSLFMKKGNI